MVFNIVIDPSALKELKKLKKGVPQTFSRLVRSIDSLAKSPFEGKPLQGNKKGCYSLREGDYRLIYEVHLNDKAVHVIAVGHRKEIYR
jgi:mRNA interferase RelE/StbE